MDERTLDRLELIARALMFGALVVLVLSLIGTVVIATSETALSRSSTSSSARTAA